MRLFIRLLLLPMIALFLFGAYATVSEYVLARKSSGWHVTHGLIIDSDSIEVRNAGQVTAGVSDYRVFVKYKYSVGKTSFDNTTISFPAPPHFTSRLGADAYRKAYRLNDTVQVFYNPDHPAQSCLLLPKGSQSLLATLGSVAMFVVLTALCIYGLRIIP
ncbi:MAG: DUF3592 domain-containing protein, partial [Candidatus Electrothrix sp. AR4]|nr:DUF3592 domain-containing protein [Candidatus Electrothrix sp. AR4]